MFQGILKPLDLQDLDTQLVPVAVEYKKLSLFVACAENLSVLQLHVKSCKCTILRRFSHPLLGSLGPD